MNQLIGAGLSALFGMLKTEAIKDFIDAGLDKLEDKYIQGEADNPKEIAIRKAIDLLRSLLNIQDEKYGTDKK